MSSTWSSSTASSSAAGDSGDGMQRPTGDQFTSRTASFGNDLATLPDFPAEIRATSRHHPRRLGVPAALRRPTSPPRATPQRARRDEPRRAQGQPQGHPARRGHHRQHRRKFTSRNLTKVGYMTPTRSRTARSSRTPSTRSAHLDDRRGAQGIDIQQEGGRAREEHVRARPALPALPPPHRGHADLPAPEVREEAGDPRANITAFEAGWSMARPPRTSRCGTRSSRRRWPRAATATSLRQPRAVPRPHRRLAACRIIAAVPRVLPDHPRPRTSCTS